MVAKLSCWKALPGLIASILVIVLQGCERTDSTDTLGLTVEDRRFGGSIDIEVLRKNAEAAADGYLSKQVDALKEFKGPYTQTIDYSLVPLIRRLGYKSSFYYFCWDIFLPYRFKTDSGDSYILVVQVSDRIPGNKHDIKEFHVLRMKIIDDLGQVKKLFGENASQ